MKATPFWTFTLLVMFDNFSSTMAIDKKDNLIAMVHDYIPLSFHSNSIPITSCKLLDRNGWQLLTKLSRSRNSCTHHVQNASSSDSGNYTWHIDEGLPSSTLKNITLTIISDNITLDHAVSCPRNQDFDFFCTAKDTFPISPLMELWDGKSKTFLSSSFNPVSIQEGGVSRYKFPVKCDMAMRLCCKTGGYPAYLSPDFHNMHESCTDVLPTDVPVDSKGTWIGILSGAIIMLLAAVIGVFIYYRKREAYTEENAVITPVAAQQMSNEAALKAQNNDDEPFLQQYRTKDNTTAKKSPSRLSITNLPNIPKPSWEPYQPLVDDPQQTEMNADARTSRQRVQSCPTKLPTTYRNSGRLNSDHAAVSLHDTLIEIPEDGATNPDANDVFQPKE